MEVTYTPEQLAAFAVAVSAKLDTFVPACGLREVPFRYQGNTYTYMWNPRTGEHMYYWKENDILVSDYRC